MQPISYINLVSRLPCWICSSVLVVFAWSLGFSVYSSILPAYSEFYLFPSGLGTFSFFFFYSVAGTSSLLCWVEEVTVGILILLQILVGRLSVFHHYYCVGCGLVISSVQSLSHVRLFATPWTAARQDFLSITNSQSPPKPMSIESVMVGHPTISSSVVPFSSCPQSFPASGSFQMSQFFPSGGQSIGVSASTSVPPMNTQDWSLLRWTGWISLQSKGLSRVFSDTTVQRHQFFGAQLSL